VRRARVTSSPRAKWTWRWPWVPEADAGSGQGLRQGHGFLRVRGRRSPEPPCLPAPPHRPQVAEQVHGLMRGVQPGSAASDAATARCCDVPLSGVAWFLARGSTCRQPVRTVRGRRHRALRKRAPAWNQLQQHMAAAQACQPQPPQSSSRGTAFPVLVVQTMPTKVAAPVCCTWKKVAPPPWPANPRRAANPRPLCASSGCLNRR